MLPFFGLVGHADWQSGARDPRLAQFSAQRGRWGRFPPKKCPNCMPSPLCMVERHAIMTFAIVQNIHFLKTCQRYPLICHGVPCSLVPHIGFPYRVGVLPNWIFGGSGWTQVLLLLTSYYSYYSYFTSDLAALTIEALGLGNPICCAMGEGAGPPKMPKGK